MLRYTITDNLTLKVKTYLNRHNLIFAVICAAAVISVGTFMGWYNNKIIPLSTNPIAHYTVEPHNPLSFMSNWDGPDYIAIATNGYHLISQASFFPLYPLLIHLVNLVIGSPLDSALLISWVCLVGAIYYYIKIIKQLFKVKNNVDSLKALIFFVLFPTAIFLSATYTASLFALLALGAIYYAINGRYVLASIYSLLCCSTHLDGLFVLALIGMILLEQKLELKKIAASLVIGLLGIIGYSIYLGHKFSSPLAFVLSQKGHGWLSNQYRTILINIDLLNLIFIVLIIVAAFYWWNRRRSFSIYSLLFLLIPLVGSQFGGFNRYVLMAFPLQFMAYDYLKKRPVLYPLCMCVLGILWAYTTFQYAGGYIGS